MDDTSCGGTAEDNNVWGEGRLDALALANAAPTEDTGTLTGTVTEAGTGDPIEDATVTVTGPADRETQTEENGECLLPRTKTAVIDGVYPRGEIFRGDERKRFRLGAVTDSFGHTWLEEESAYTEGDTAVALTGVDATVAVALPFSFTFYGASYDTVHLATNGHANFLAPSTAYVNTALPDPAAPNALIAPFWDDLMIDEAASVWSPTGGDAGSQWFTVEWRNATFYPGTKDRVDFTVTLHVHGDPARER